MFVLFDFDVNVSGITQILLSYKHDITMINMAPVCNIKRLVWHF